MCYEMQHIEACYRDGYVALGISKGKTIQNEAFDGFHVYGSPKYIEISLRNEGSKIISYALIPTPNF